MDNIETEVESGISRQDGIRDKIWMADRFGKGELRMDYGMRLERIGIKCCMFTIDVRVVQM